MFYYYSFTELLHYKEENSARNCRNAREKRSTVVYCKLDCHRQGICTQMVEIIKMSPIFVWFFFFLFQTSWCFWPWSSQLGLWTLWNLVHLQRAVWNSHCCTTGDCEKLSIIASNHLNSSNKAFQLHARTAHSFHLCFWNLHYTSRKLKSNQCEDKCSKKISRHAYIQESTLFDWIIGCITVAFWVDKHKFKLEKFCWNKLK